MCLVLALALSRRLNFSLFVLRYRTWNCIRECVCVMSGLWMINYHRMLNVISFYRFVRDTHL